MAGDQQFSNLKIILHTSSNSRRSGGQREHQTVKNYDVVGRRRLVASIPLHCMLGKEHQMHASIKKKAYSITFVNDGFVQCKAKKM